MKNPNDPFYWILGTAALILLVFLCFHSNL
jgi:hypothetical protein